MRRMSSAMENGFTRDGFIFDQSRLEGMPYGRFRSSWNGCGWIAAYNLLRSQGIDASCDEIRREMGCPKAQVIATGGMARLIAGKSGVIDHIDGLLTLKGLRLIYEKNVRPQ